MKKDFMLVLLGVVTIIGALVLLDLIGAIISWGLIHFHVQKATPSAGFLFDQFGNVLIACAAILATILAICVVALVILLLYGFGQAVSAFFESAPQAAPAQEGPRTMTLAEALVFADDTAPTDTSAALQVLREAIFNHLQTADSTDDPEDLAVIGQAVRDAVRYDFGGAHTAINTCRETVWRLTKEAPAMMAADPTIAENLERTACYLKAVLGAAYPIGVDWSFDTDEDFAARYAQQAGGA